MDRRNLKLAKQMTEIIEHVCANEPEGIVGLGAHEAIRTMLPHWQRHLQEGWSSNIVQADIASLIAKLQSISETILQEMKARAVAADADESKQ